MPLFPGEEGYYHLQRYRERMDASAARQRPGELMCVIVPDTRGMRRTLRRQLARSNRRVQRQRLRKALGDLVAHVAVTVAYRAAYAWDRIRYGR